MGKEFGNLQRLYGISYYSLSPYELKPFKGFFNPGIFNFMRNLRTNLLPALPYFVAFYIVYDESNKAHHRMNRKNPDDFKDDE